MCGILITLPAIGEECFKHSLNKLSHRGPDGEGFWSEDNDNICLGHRRLSILDLSETGKQPMSYLNYIITYNGEIYNFLELRELLRKQGYRFRSNSDTEVIVAAYDAWGIDCLKKFNGMWSFGIWDNKNKKLFISRDRFGKKPLYYSLTNDTLIFASEMKAIFPLLSEIKPSQDFHWCKNHIFEYESTQKCIIDGIKRFPAASYAIIDPKQRVVSPELYWNIEDSIIDVPDDYNDQVEMFKDLFLNACKIRMRADVPISTSLSGGIDSSAVLCTISDVAKKRHMNNRISEDWQHAFIACFKGTILDERQFANIVVDSLGISAHFIEIDPVEEIDKLLYQMYMFEDLYITPPSPMVKIYNAIKENGLKVSIDGHGADEMLAGYGKDVLYAFIDAGININLIKDIFKTYEGLIDIDSDQVEKGQKIVFEYFKILFKVINSGIRGDFKYLKYLNDALFVNYFKGKQKKQPVGAFNNYLFKIFNKTVLPTLLRNYDKYSMMEGVEVRMPFLDHRLVSFIFSLPWQSKIKNGYTKAILRDACKDFLPVEIYQRTSKIGYHSPLVEWMRGPWKNFFFDLMHTKEFKESVLINQKLVENSFHNLLNSSKALFLDGQNCWTAIMPFIWEYAMKKYSKL